jgi:hypothetical protein
MALETCQSRLSEINLGDSDNLVWTVARKRIYMSSDTWNALRKKKPEVIWWSLIWFPYAIPKQAFLLWLAVRNRLTTGDRLLVWGYKGDTQCGFCRHGLESRDHLFFRCSFSSRIWKNCMQRCNIENPDIDWLNVMDTGCRQWKTKRMWGVLCRLVLQSAVYHLWRARNEIKHNGCPKTEEQVLRSIYWDVRFRFSGNGRFAKTRESVNLCLNWNISFSVLV